MSFLRQQGFTLVEILIVTGVSAAIITLGFAQYNKFNERQRIMQAAEDFVTTFRLIQKRADGGERSSSCGTNPVTNYEISRQGTTQFNFIVYCGGNDYQLNRYALKNNTELLNQSLWNHPTQDSNDRHIEIIPLGRGIRFQREVRIGIGSCYIPITINVSGSITLGALTGC